MFELGTFDFGFIIKNKAAFLWGNRFSKEENKLIQKMVNYANKQPVGYVGKIDFTDNCIFEIEKEEDNRLRIRTNRRI